MQLTLPGFSQTTENKAGGQSDIIGRAIAGNNRLADGRTLTEAYPEKYSNCLTDWVALLIAEEKAKLSLAQIQDIPEKGD
ncbi:MAG: hypothetical protein KJ077_10995 [Anaerolineae bacterium]|nr:hypothetical protein [Anaerolineae bacterium]